MGVYAQGYGKGNAHWQASRFRTDSPAVTQYVATASSTTSVTVGTASWTTNEHQGKIIRIADGTYADSFRKVASNTATVLTFADALPGAPSATVAFSLMTPLTVLAAKTFFCPVLTGVTFNYDGNASSAIALISDASTPVKMHCCDLGAHHTYTHTSATGWDILGSNDSAVVLVTLAGTGIFSLTAEGYWLHKDTPKSYV